MLVLPALLTGDEVTAIRASLKGAAFVDGRATQALFIV